jgi:hypothetical protein
MFTVGPGVPCTNLLEVLPGGVCSVLNPAQLLTDLGIKQLRRCPGSNERGLTDDQLTQGGAVDCVPDEVPIGP